MKKFLTSRIFLVIISGILFTSLGVYASSFYNAKDIIYNNDNSEVVNVNEALDELYSITNLGDASATDILKGKTALVQGKLIEGLKEDKNISIISAKHNGGNYTDLEPGTYALILTGTVQTNGSARPSVGISLKITGGTLISKDDRTQNSDYGPDWYGFRDTVWLFTITDETNTVKTTVTYGTPNVGCFKLYSVLVGLK